MHGAAKQTHSCLKERHSKHALKFERLKQESTPLEVTTTLRHGNAACDMHATASFGLRLTHVHLNMQMQYVLINL